MSWSAEWKPPLNSQMNALKEKIHARTMRALLQCGYKIQGDAQKLVPVDTGRLKTSISVKMENEIVYIGTNVFYGKYVEYGTGIYAESGQGRQTPWVYYAPYGKYQGFHWTQGQSPSPWLRPAFIMNKEWVKDYLIKSIKEL